MRGTDVNAPTVIGNSLSCTTALARLSGSITITGYYKNTNTNLWICVGNFPAATVSGVVFNGAAKTTTITWPNTGNVTGIILSIEKNSCQSALLIKVEYDRALKPLPDYL